MRGNRPAALLLLLAVLLWPSIVAAQTPTPEAESADGRSPARYAVALALVGAASVLSTTVAAAVVRNMQRVAPPPDDERN